MRRFILIAAAAVAVMAIASTGMAQQISGDYIETRSADVYTGPCFANSEVNLTGDEAIMAWKVNRGEWNGVRLDGLSVVAVVKASGTLGDEFENPYPAKTVFIVDRNGTTQQQQALVGFAQSMGGKLLTNAVKVEVAPIDIQVDHHGMHYAGASVQAGNVAGIRTRSINEKDHLCGNEETFYPPLAETVHSMPEVALLDEYTGTGLGVSWTSHGRRSAFVGGFSR
ncbi:MAG TPA: DUF1326 domain-containing protein [Blastocatellia bacterium]|nr:DUF1326 domain-containing protein [Blastocatellia bacterium]